MADAPSAVFAGGADGAWLDPTPLTRFHTTSSSGVSPSAYSADAGGDQGSWGRWLDRSGNGRDATVTVTDTTRPVVINPASPNNWRYYININEVSASIANAGGSNTGGFYLAFTGQPRNYYGELFSDVNTANTGFKLEHDADGPSFKFSVGNGSARFTASVNTGWTRYANPPSSTPRLFECWWDATANKIFLAVDGGTPAEATITGSVSAGLSTLKINGNLAADQRHTEVYELVVAKNHLPSAAVRADVASYLSAGLSPPPPYQDGSATISSASSVSGAAQAVRGGAATISSVSSVAVAAQAVRSASAAITSASSVTAAGEVPVRYVDASASIASESSVTAAGEAAPEPVIWDGSAIIAAISSASASALVRRLWEPVQDTAGAWTEVSAPAATWTPVEANETPWSA